MRSRWDLRETRLATALAAGALLALVGCGSTPVQPISFNHKLHVTRGALECDSCHETVFEQTYAGLPPLKTCMRCHRKETPDDPEAAKHVEVLRGYDKAGTEVPWQRVYKVPPYVFFSHRRHTDVGGLKCEICHGAMAELTSPPEHPADKTTTMPGCIGCHEAKKVTTDCAACHH